MTARPRSNDRPDAGQALVEFLVVLPLMVLLICLILQDYVIQERQQKANMSIWYLLRGSTYPYTSPGPKDDDLISDAIDTFFQPKDDVKIQISNTVNDKNSNDSSRNDGRPVVYNGDQVGLGLISALGIPVGDYSLEREVSVHVTFPNPFRYPFGNWLNQETFQTEAHGYIWVSWTTMWDNPQQYVDRASNADSEANKNKDEMKKAYEEAIWNAEQQAKDCQQKWQDADSQSQPDLQCAANFADSAAEEWAKECKQFFGDCSPRKPDKPNTTCPNVTCTTPLAPPAASASAAG